MPPAEWPDGTRKLTQELHDLMKISDRDWHRLKTSSDRRAAELLMAALAQLTAKYFKKGEDDFLCQLNRNLF